jgi:hypothetical protein
VRSTRWRSSRRPPRPAARRWTTHKVGAAAIAGTAALVAAAKRLSAPAVHTVERVETVLHEPAPPGAGCDQAWDKIEEIHNDKAGAAR